MQTREQVYATSVFECVERRKNSYASEGKNKYGSMAHKLPVLIRSAGLAQALAFADTRKDEQKELLKDLSGVLGYETPNDLVTHVRRAKITEYMLLTEHALAALLWFKRYAQSVLDVTSDVQPNDGGTP